ncbi:hypothetical protein PTKIN_Ptkin10aG0069100 [Pterospermum kingtungense]
MLAWIIWTRCNQELHGYGRKDVIRSVQFAFNYIKEYKLAQESQVVNNKEEKRSGVGFLIRGHEGKVMGAMAVPLDGVSDPLLIEMPAIVKALKFSRDMSFGNVYVEGDALGVINRFGKVDLDLSSVGMVVDEGKRLVQ